MTSLHYTLIALGIGLVGAVVLYNLWQERRSRRLVERLFDPGKASGHSREPTLGDLPMAEEMAEKRIEPRIQLLDDDAPLDTPSVPVYEPEPMSLPQPAAEQPEPPAESVPAPEPAPGPVTRPEPPAPPAAEPAAQAMAPESPLDGEVEFVARLRYTQPAVVQFASLQDGLRRISKPIRMVGRREDGTWEPILGHGSRPYDTVEMALLLADRAGPVSEVQLDTFCRRLYDFASEHGGAVSCQDKQAALERAKALDAFCAEVDMLIGLNVIPRDGGFDGQSVYELAVRAGLGQGVDGTYSLRDDKGRLLFTLSDGGTGQEAPGHGVVLLFDVPRVAIGLAAFDRMTALALELAERLGGRLVDDGGRPVSRASLERDRKSLETIYARMAAQGIPAGGERALRLFA